MLANVPTPVLVGVGEISEDEMTKRTFEANDRHVQEDLIDPGPIPEITPTRPQQKELRKALAAPVKPMRKDKN